MRELSDPGGTLEGMTTEADGLFELDEPDSLPPVDEAGARATAPLAVRMYRAMAR